MNPTLRWDAHSCVPLRSDYAIERLSRHREAGFHFVSINVGMDMNPVTDIVQIIASFRERIRDSPGLLLAEYFDDIDLAASSGRMAVSFDLEGAKPLMSNPAMVALYQRLGIRQMHFAYNRSNEAAGGCYDPEAGLTALGRVFLRACEENGIVVDCTHLNERSSLQIMDSAAKPVVFSHSNVRRLNGDLRNVTDTVIDRCAAQGGVIGIAGMSRLLSGQRADLHRFVEQVDYVAQRVGPLHVGIGLDYVYDPHLDELPEGADVSYWFPREHGYDQDYYKSCTFLPPETLSSLNEALRDRGYATKDIAAISGNNFARVAKQCWQPRPPKEHSSTS